MKRKVQFAPGSIYHLYNRGVAKCTICDQEVDYWRFLQGLCLFNDQKTATNILWQLERNRGRLTLRVLREYIQDKNYQRHPLVRILAYCIMGNHFHLLVEELKEGGIIKFMHKLGLGYARYFNNKYERVGSLFQSRFKAVPVEDERYLQYLLVYINVLNPAQLEQPNWKGEGIKDVAKIMQIADQCLWSTHQEYSGKRQSIIIDKGLLGRMFSTSQSYLELVEGVLRGKKYEEIRHLALE